MDKRYKIIISNNNLYKEIELTPSMQQLKLGTDISCDVRLRKELFFCGIELVFVKNEGEWTVYCSDNLYLTDGDIRKLITKKLKHGDSLELKYNDSNNLALSLDFYIDFDDGRRKYDRALDISGLNTLSIGTAPDSSIVLSGMYVRRDAILLRRVSSGFRVEINSTTFGVYLNGRKASSGDIIKNTDFLSVSDYFFYFKDDRIWTQIREDAVFNGISYQDLPFKNSYPRFNRNTRIKTLVNREQIDILDPPPLAKKPKNNMLTRLLPAIGMLLAAGVMAFMGGGMIIMAAISAVMAVTTSLLTFRESKKEYKKNIEDRLTKYNSYIKNKRRDIESFRNQEKEVLDQVYISREEELNRFESFSSSLFDRSADDSDFLCVKLGSGAVEAERKISYKKKETLSIDDELELLPGKLEEDYKYIQDAPVVCRMKELSALGIVGREADRFSLFKNIIIDIVARQYFSDLNLVLVTEAKNTDKIYWLRMLPQVFTEDQKLRLLVTDDESKNIVFEYLYKELSLRQQSKNKNFRHILVFFYDEYGFKSHPISRFVKDAKELGVTFVFFGDSTADVPMGCGNIISLHDSSNGSLIDTADSGKTIDFRYSELSNEQAKKIIDLMSPVYSEEISLEGSLTKNISLFKMLNILAVDDINLEQRWGSSMVYKSMAAPIGVSKSGLVYLDLHDKAHGPHGLVAGTTGSGKSEILQTYILSMATLFHPYEVGFVIIDFKGGGMVNQFKDLPHLMGAITNIDGREINRSLKSIKAELQKRQRLFAEAEVNHIDKYIRKYKKGEVGIPLPHLILIVDEFAELKAEQPEFMKELISAARIGRSLGVHLILATQKPSGQVNEQIWSNSKFKLCLKVQSQEDSNEVIKSPLAAEIKEPGRAYLQVGNNEIFELFQSAYSGAPEKMDDSSIKEFSINSLSVCGRRSQVYAQQRKKEAGAINTQLDALVKYISDYTEKNSIARLPNICLPPLEKLIDLPVGLKSREGRYALGFYDDPDNQYQGPVYYDINTENTLIVGAPQTGKTNLIQLLIREITTEKSPAQAVFYIMDFGSMILKNFERLNHVGGVVLPSEEEKLKNLFKLLLRELEQRRERLMSVGVSSMSSYYEAGYKDFPHIYLILENFAVFKELYSEKYEDDFLYLAREGSTYGLTIIMTSANTGGLSYRYLSNFANHVAFNCVNKDEYTTLFERCRTELPSIPGRMLVGIDRAFYEAQCYLSFKGEKEIDRISEIRSYISETNSRCEGMAAVRIPEVPDVFSLDYIRDNYHTGPGEIALALSYQYVEPVRLSISSTSQLMIVGRAADTVAAFNRALIAELKYNYFERAVDAYIIDNLTRDMAAYKNEPFVREYSIDYSKLSDIFDSVSDELEDRYSDVMENGTGALDDKPLIFIMVNNPSAIDYISSSKELMSIYNSMATRYKAMKIMLVFSGIADQAISFGSGELLKKLKECRNAFIFSNMSEHKVFDIPGSFVRQNKKPIDITQGYYLKEDEIVKIRFIKEE